MIKSTISEVLGINPFYLDVASWREYKVYTIDESEKDLVVSRVVDSYIQSNLSSKLGQDDINVSTIMTSSIYNGMDCQNFYSTEVSIGSLGNITIFISSERVHIQLTGPNR